MEEGRKYYKFSPLPRWAETHNGDPYPDYERGSSQWVDWLEEQKYYCLNGYDTGGDHISGRHYFMLNHTKRGISDIYKNKVPTYAYYADAQREFFDKIEYCFEKERNILGLKGRGKGWTYDVADVALYEMVMMEYSKVMALFPGGTSTARGKFRAAYDMGYNVVHPDFKFPAKNGGSVDLLEYSWDEETEDEQGKKVMETCGPHNSLDMIIAINESVVRSGRHKVVIVEELGEIKNPKKLISVVDENMREGSLKIGMLIAGGTSDCFNEDGYNDYVEMWYEPEMFDFEKIFIPAHKQYWGYINLETGVSDMDGAYAYRMAIRKKKEHDKEALLIDMQENPSTPEEAFSQSKLSPYDTVKINNQIAYILSTPEVKNSVQVGNLMPSRNPDGSLKAVWQICSNGKWEIFKHPDTKRELMFPMVGAVDGYRLGGKVEDSESQGAIEVYVPYQGVNIAGNYPAMVYMHRDPDKEVFFMDCLLTAIYYDCKLLIERTDQDIFTFFKKYKALKYIKEKPEAVKTEWSRKKGDKNKLGVVPSPFAVGVSEEASIQDFNRNYHQIVFVSLLREMANYKKKNTDRVMAHQWAVLHAVDNMPSSDDLIKTKKESKFTPTFYRVANGNIIYNNQPSERASSMLRGKEAQYILAR